jgi:ligand-binding SRPBCC domain-containing protein
MAAKALAHSIDGVADEVATFEWRSIVPAPAREVFAWHERPDAFLELAPSRRLVTLLERDGGIRDGGRLRFRMGVGPFAIEWHARHYGYVEGVQFCDEQVSGPFRVWRHTHRVVPVGPGACAMEDHIEYALKGGRFWRRLAGPIVRRLLAVGFAQRHRALRDSLRRLGTVHTEA